MKPTLALLLEIIETLAPSSLAEGWDNVGLLVGARSRPCTSVLVGLDPTIELLEEAIEKGSDTVITHHPAIFKALSNIDTDSPNGRFLEKAFSGKINVIACHTNLDAAQGGINDHLAQSLGLQEIAPLQHSQASELPAIARIGHYPQALEQKEFLARVFHILELDYVAATDNLPNRIQTVAVCGGSGSDFAEAALEKGADVYLTGEIKHSTAIWARQAGLALIDGTHYATEKAGMSHFAKRFSAAAKEHGLKIEISNTTKETPPFVQLSRGRNDQKK
ncbi:unnamed protein product [Cyprideis torosa]|uniref:NIF3-like protein 1 n=1 Tax=Cyprideis torosa TaxID=163714 RepID=A0A7R8WTU2_9CRUS|nr:unnamed protein product [Cyprideis torosa]CAG0910128.1 unnamed protein product [Cyprideis torosa]